MAGRNSNSSTILEMASMHMSFKVQILGQIYALKLVKQGATYQHAQRATNVYVCIFDFTSRITGMSVGQIDRLAMGAFYKYMDPFNCECRAFGRSQEAGCEELAIKCFQLHAKQLKWYCECSDEMAAKLNAHLLTCVEPKGRAYIFAERGAVNAMRLHFRAISHSVISAHDKYGGA